MPVTVVSLPPPGQWHDIWSWAEVGIISKGLDGDLHAFELQNGSRTKVIG